MATVSPLLGIPLPQSTDTDQVPSDLMGAFSFAEKTFIGVFSSAAARNAKIATPTAGMVCYLQSPGYHTWYDGTQWRPIGGLTLGSYTGANVGSGVCVVTNVNDTSGFCNVLTPTVQAFPTVHTVTIACLATGTTGDTYDVQLYSNGSAIKRVRVAANTSGSFPWVQNVAASATQTWQGIIVKASGSGATTAISADGTLTYLTVQVTAA